MKEFTIQNNEAGQRFDKYLKKLLNQAGSSFIYKMLRKKNIVLNGKKADGSEKLEAGDSVKLFLSDETFDKFAGSSAGKTEADTFLNLDVSGLQVVYEDADVIIINKPSGMLSQKAKPEDISANEYIIAYLLKSKAIKPETFHTFKPSVCNRLDRNTSGLLIAGKTLKGLQEMSKALKDRSVQKYYRCIVKGEVKEEAYLKGYLFKDEASNQVTILKHPKGEGCLPVETAYRPLFSSNGYSELEVHLITGRSHQIRAHLASIGHPIVGDPKYGEKEVNDFFLRKLKVKSQLLHAYRIIFSDGKEVIAPTGRDYDKALNFLTLP